MINAALDVSRLAWPTDWESQFGRNAPLLVEIGFGTADFLVFWAEKRPDANLIGIEISLPSVKKAEKKTGRLDTQNVRVIYGDARILLWGAIEPNGIDHLYLNFPDPWHKDRHKHRQLITDEFLELAASRMPPGALLDIATDVPDYQMSILDALTRTRYFESRAEDQASFLLADPERLTTKYELKAAREGRTSKYYKYRRTDVVPAADKYPVLKEHDMPHTILKTDISPESIAERFEPTRIDGEIPVRLLNVYAKKNSHSEHQDQVLFEVHIVEEPMPQRLALMLDTRNDGTLMLSIHELGFPRPTYGAHVAIAHVTRWILSLDQSIELVRHNLSCGI